MIVFFILYFPSDLFWKLSMKYILVLLILSVTLVTTWCVIQEWSSITNSGTGTKTWEQYSLQDLEQRIVDIEEADPESQYLNQKSINNLYLLIDYLVSNFEYLKAASYYQELISQTNNWDRPRLLHILVNDLQPEPWHYDTLYNFLTSYISSWTISTEEALFYKFTLDLLREKFNKEDINLLTGKYIDFKNNLRRQYDTFYSYKDAPDYYLYALFGITYFKHQDFGIAKALADIAIKSNPNYILPYQIKAYVGLLTKQFDIAKQSLDVLVQLDLDKLERYQFLLWLMYYSQNDVIQAKNYFLQMKSPVLKIEGLRYLIDLERQAERAKTLSPVQDNGDELLNDHGKAVLRYLESFFISPDTKTVSQLKSVDFQTVFDRYIYDRLRVGSQGGLEMRQLYLQHPDILDNALKLCDKLLQDEQFVCQYGEAGKLLLDNKSAEALRILIPLSKQYPQWQTYYIIWLLYKEQGLFENAGVYFVKALQYSESSQKSALKDMMMELLNGSIQHE